MSEKFFSRTVEEMEVIFNKAENTYSNEYIDNIAETVTNIGLMKVDKEEGKGLSSNDFTTEEKEKLAGLENYDSTELKANIAFNRSTLGFKRKNMLKNTAVSQTKNGVTFMVNADGSVTANGTAAAKTDFVLFIGAPAESMYNAVLTVSGCPQNGSAETYRTFVQDMTSGYITLATDNGNGADLTLSRSVSKFRCIITIYEGYTAENLTFYPMLRYADIIDDTYEPYKPSVEEHIADLEARIAALEGVIT